MQWLQQLLQPLLRQLLSRTPLSQQKVSRLECLLLRLCHTKLAHHRLQLPCNGSLFSHSSFECEQVKHTDSSSCQPVTGAPSLGATHVRFGSVMAYVRQNWASHVHASPAQGILCSRRHAMHGSWYLTSCSAWTAGKHAMFAMSKPAACCVMLRSSHTSAADVSSRSSSCRHSTAPQVYQEAVLRCYLCPSEGRLLDAPVVLCCVVKYFIGCSLHLQTYVSS